MKVERKLSTGAGDIVFLYIEMPKRSDKLEEFYCKIGIFGVDFNFSSKIYGIDPMQALLLSVRHLESFSDSVRTSIHPTTLSWDLGTSEDILGLKIIE